MRPRVGSRVVIGYGRRRVYTIVDVPGALRALGAAEDGTALGLLDLYLMQPADVACEGCGGVGAHTSGDCPRWPTRGHAYKPMAISLPPREPNCRICDRDRDNGMHFESRETG